MIRQRQLRRAASRRVAIVLGVVAAAVAIGATLAGVAGSTSPRPALDRQAVAKPLQKTAGRFMTAPAQAALAMLANGTHQWGSAGMPSPEAASTPAQLS